MISVVLIFLIFASIHSITASQMFKRSCQQRLGDTFMRVYYRALYNLVSMISFGAVLYLAARIPDQKVWTAPVWLKWTMHGIQAAGLVLGALSFRQQNGWEFMGLRQIGRHLARHETQGNSEGMTDGALVTTGVYGIVRHPLYLAGIMIVVCNPVLTVNGLTFTVLAAIYFLFGAFIEERRFVEQFGDRYRVYKKQVPRLVPRMSVVVRVARKLAGGRELR